MSIQSPEEKGSVGSGSDRTPPIDPNNRDLEIIKTASPRAYAHLQKVLQQQSTQIVVRLPTYLIRPSRFANRHAVAFESADFTALRVAIKERGGNTQPIFVRPIADAKRESLSGEQGDQLYEIVSGHRRHQACHELNLPVKAIVVTGMTDSELVMCMFDENNARVDISPFEAGRMYAGWIEQRLFSSQHDLAEAIKRSPSDVSRAIYLARLPESILRAFESPLVLQYKDADVLRKIISNNPFGIVGAAECLSSFPKKKGRSEILRLFQLASEGEDVTSIPHPPRNASLKVKNQIVGAISWDAHGRGRVKLDQKIAPEAQKSFEEMIEKFIAKTVFKSKKKVQQPTAFRCLKIS